MEPHLTATGCHLAYLTVSPATWHKRTHPAFAAARQAGTRFTYPGGMEGWVDLGDRFTWFTQTVTHPSSNRGQSRATTLPIFLHPNFRSSPYSVWTEE